MDFTSGILHKCTLLLKNKLYTEKNNIKIDYAERENMKNTTLCYIEHDGKYLMLHRTKKVNDENKDKWVGIGGKFEQGESPEECVGREALEETGLKIKSPRYRGIVTFVSEKWGTEYMHLFTCSDFEGQIKESCDEGELMWIEKEKLLECELWEGDKIFLRLIADDKTPFFSLKLHYDKDDVLVSHVLKMYA